MIELKKSELEAALITIAAYDSKTGKMVSGLLSEAISLGTKRKIQKIQKKLHESYKEFLEDLQEIRKEATPEEIQEGEPTEETKKELAAKADSEFKILLEEVVKLDVEQFQISQIENISTSENYNFEIIEKLAI